MVQSNFDDNRVSLIIVPLIAEKKTLKDVFPSFKQYFNGNHVDLRHMHCESW